MSKLSTVILVIIVTAILVGGMIVLGLTNTEVLTAREGIASLSMPKPESGVARASSESTLSVETADPIVETKVAPATAETVIDDPAPETATEEVAYEPYVPAIEPIEGLYLDVPMSTQEQDFARSISEEYGIPFELTMAVIYAESRYDPNAISDTQDYGLMQISYVNLGWLRDELNITDILDPYQNIRAGVHILADKIRSSNGDVTIALIKYNVGDKDALKLFEQGIYSTYYTTEVLGKYYEYLRG